MYYAQPSHPFFRLAALSLACPIFTVPHFASSEMATCQLLGFLLLTVAFAATALGAFIESYPTAGVEAGKPYTITHRPQNQVCQLYAINSPGD
jgi:hypothetical protein